MHGAGVAIYLVLYQDANRGSQLHAGSLLSDWSSLRCACHQLSDVCSSPIVITLILIGSNNWVTTISFKYFSLNFSIKFNTDQ